MKYLLLFIVMSCASASVPPPAFEMRTYRTAEDLSGFEYQWRKWGRCTKPLLLWCREREELTEKEVIPFEDKVAIKRLLDAGFVLRVREKP